MPEEVPPSVWVPEAARRIITHHHAAGACPHCRPDGCRALSWARDRLKAYRMAGNRPERYV
ncbi:hypothetical protein ACIODS_09045 [Micromonospora chalcea]|uniref:hypothetical protein n=1 Tax=Micromonospora chalcea TaxID=1874 RepID=UPI003821A30F